MSFIVNDPMPKTCTECDYRCGLNIIARRDLGARHEHCPLVELPPHGRLGDLDKLEKQVTASITDRDRMCGTYDKIEMIIENAPTILEASKQD